MIKMINKMIMLGIILLIGSFTYLFEMGYHGFVHEDFNKIQILLTFLAMFLSSLFILCYEYFETKKETKDLKYSFGFFAGAIFMLFIIFYTRNINSTIPFLFSLVYFIGSLIVFVKKDMFSQISDLINSQSFFLRFSVRFFFIMGLLIFPAGVIEYIRSGVFDYSLKELYMPMISVLTYFSEGLLNLLGYSVYSIKHAGGYTLSLQDNTFSVFVGALCSGITSMSVFIAAFFAIIGDIKTSLKNKAALFVFGVAGTFFSNVLRIVFLFLIGVHIGNDALVAAHTHLGWIFFFLWISLFWTILFKISETIENNPSLKKQKKKYVPENKKQAKILQI